MPANPDSQLLPCAFCGFKKKPFIIKREGSKHDPEFYYYALCKLCTAAGPRCDTQQDAIEAWNRRAPLPATTATGELGPDSVVAEFEVEGVFIKGGEDGKEELPFKKFNISLKALKPEIQARLMEPKRQSAILQRSAKEALESLRKIYEEMDAIAYAALEKGPRRLQEEYAECHAKFEALSLLPTKEHP